MMIKVPPRHVDDSLPIGPPCVATPGVLHPRRRKRHRLQEITHGARKDGVPHARCLPSLTETLCIGHRPTSILHELWAAGCELWAVSRRQDAICLFPRT